MSQPGMKDPDVVMRGTYQSSNCTTRPTRRGCSFFHGPLRRHPLGSCGCRLQGYEGQAASWAVANCIAMLRVPGSKAAFDSAAASVLAWQRRGPPCLRVSITVLCSFQAGCPRPLGRAAGRPHQGRAPGRPSCSGVAAFGLSAHRVGY